MAETLSIPSLDGSGSFTAYLARPADKPIGAVVVIQEIFGINAGIRARCDRWAAAGYLAVAPDMFWRFAPGLELDPDVPEQLQEALGHMGKFDVNLGVTDIEATIREARDLAGGRRVGVVGYCLGGRLAYLAATRTDADACVGYYGAGIQTLLNEAHAIAKPLMLHFAEQDHIIDADVRAAIHAALDPSAHVTIHEYAGVDHGFATESGSRRDDAAATQADERTTAFFDEHLPMPA